MSITAITVTLPYPISANRYWRPVKLGQHISIVPTKEAKQFRTAVGMICKAQGVQLITGRVHVEIKLYPHRPLDWQKRMKRDGVLWDDTVQCIDIDNANKVLLDSLKGVAIDDDKFVFELYAKRMEPDANGSRVVVTIKPIETECPNENLF